MTLLTKIYLILTGFMIFQTVYHLIYHNYHFQLKKLIAALTGNSPDTEIARDMRMALTKDFYGGSTFVVVAVAILEFLWLILCFWTIGWLTLALLFVNYMVSTGEKKTLYGYWALLSIKFMYLAIYVFFGYYHLATL